MPSRCQHGLAASARRVARTRSRTSSVGGVGIATAFEVGGSIVALLGFVVMTYASNDVVQFFGGAVLFLGALVAVVAMCVGFAMRLWNNAS